MASEKLLSDEILKDAATKADRTRKRAERDARKLLDEAAKDAEANVQRILDVARRRADRIAQALLATVEQEARRDLLIAQEIEIEKLFEAARQRLADRKGSHLHLAHGGHVRNEDVTPHPAVLANLAAQAIQAMGVDRVVLRLAEADRVLATEAWLAEVRRRVGRGVAIEVAPEPAPIDGGVIVRSADGRLLYDNSFVARLGRLAPELRKELAGKLFGSARPVTRDA